MLKDQEWRSAALRSYVVEPSGHCERVCDLNNTPVMLPVHRDRYAGSEGTPLADFVGVVPVAP
jgi:hypothetical protein